MFSPRVQPQKNAINEEKMDAIIDAILQGKYSIACLLLLEATGYNPLQYMPYRTYNRLQKQRRQAVAASTRPNATASKASVTTLRKDIIDLDYVEPLPEKLASREGGRTANQLGNNSIFFPWLRMPYFQTTKKCSKQQNAHSTPKPYLKNCQIGTFQ